MSDTPEKRFFENIYQKFSGPLSNIDCGKKCGPFNDYGVPVCCDINLIIPSAYKDEWEFLEEKTNLWQPWSSSNPIDAGLENDVQDDQVLLKCLGYQHCQRSVSDADLQSFSLFPLP